MKRHDTLEFLAGLKGDGISVATMRSIPDWYDVSNAPNLHLDNQGCMGAAAAFGLGLAIAQPQRRVMVLDGDGSLCMQMGGLVSIAGMAPSNYYHFVLVNRIYETSGKQPVPNAEKVDFPAIALGAGYANAYHFDDLGVLRERLPSIMVQPGPVLISLEIDPEDQEQPTPAARPRDRAGALRESLVGSI